MKINSFINQQDPSKDITEDLNNISLEKQYSQLTDKEKVLVFCKINGYNRVPPSIERLYSDEYYLGGDKFFDHGNNLFTFWKGALNKIFPNEVLTAKPFLVLSGAIGIGKSTVSRLCLAETYARLLCMKNPSKTLHLSPKPFSAVIFHRSEETAIIEFKKWFDRDVLEFSPFFKNIKPNNFKFNVITSGPFSSGGLGQDVLYFCMGEVNFWRNQESAQARCSSSLIRFTSRFNEEAITKVGQFILDSSAAGNNSVTNWFLENTNPELTWNCCENHWTVKPQDYKKSNGRTFSIYSGDGKYPPQILPEDYKLAEDQDPDRVIHPPIQLYQEAKTDLIRFLQDKGGISTGSQDSFFSSIEHLINCSTIKNRIPEVVTVDFYDKTDRLYPKVEPMINLLPRDTFVVLGLDLAVVSDYAGISLSSFWGWKAVNNVKVPTYRTHFVLGITNKEGQQISLFHIQELIEDLHNRFPNMMVSADQAFSRQVLQFCEANAIPTRYISTDNSPCEPALYLKNVILNEQIELPDIKRLQREVHDLITTTTNTGKYKVDHPKKATQDPRIFDVNNGVGSKDLWDSLSQSIYCLKLCIDEGNEYGFAGSYTRQINAVSKMVKSDPKEVTQRLIQNMLEDIF